MARALIRARVEHCSFLIPLLSLFAVEDNSVSLVLAFVPACDRQWTR
jgi:hypothetical protein